jgi:lipopolysaccharide export system protein LptA
MQDYHQKNFQSLPFKQCLCYLLMIMGACYTHSTIALEKDAKAPIEIEANRATVDELKQMAIYEGSVALSQGTLRISASQLTAWSKDNQVDKLEAKGEPATYTQAFEDNPNPIYAEAKVIYYFPQSGKITLEKNARVTQGQHRFEGDYIEYDIQKQKLSAKGETNPQGEKMSRVKVVIPPQSSGSLKPQPSHSNKPSDHGQ